MIGIILLLVINVGGLAILSSVMIWDHINE